ncbi:MAG: hypothetical protein C0403_05200 [Desulfobacterium sp.]|nr:hypothetical protein [Desulfobacterium sp.]
MKNSFSLWLSIFILLISANGFSQEKESLSPENRFSARLEFGLMGMTTNSSYIAVYTEDALYDSDRFPYINSLGKRDSYLSYGTSFFLFDVNYMIKDDIIIYVGTPFFDDSRKGLTFGTEKLFQDQSILGLSIFIGNDALWKDPYATYVDREATYSYRLGTTIEYDGILGSELNMNYTFQGLIVIDDESGARNPDLKRDGITHTFETGYRFFLTDTYDTILTPSIFYTIDHSKGEAYQNNSFGTELDFSTETGKNGYTVSGTYIKHHFNGIHPIFDEKRTEDTYLLKCFYTRKNLMDSNWYTRIGGVYEYVDSNIDFFKQHSFYYGVSLGYTFE